MIGCCWSFTMGFGTYPWLTQLHHVCNTSLNSQWECSWDTVRKEKCGGDKTSGQAWLVGSPNTSVHLFKEFVGGVFIAVVLHFIELSLLRCQHGVNLLWERQRHRLLSTKRQQMLCNWLFPVLNEPVILMAWLDRAKRNHLVSVCIQGLVILYFWKLTKKNSGFSFYSFATVAKQQTNQNLNYKSTTKYPTIFFFQQNTGFVKLLVSLRAGKHQY